MTPYPSTKDVSFNTSFVLLEVLLRLEIGLINPF